MINSPGRLRRVPPRSARQRSHLIYKLWFEPAIASYGVLFLPVGARTRSPPCNMLEQDRGRWDHPTREARSRSMTVEPDSRFGSHRSDPIKLQRATPAQCPAAELPVRLLPAKSILKMKLRRGRWDAVSEMKRFAIGHTRPQQPPATARSGENRGQAKTDDFHPAILAASAEMSNS
jgi:hypothetical protein